MEAAGQHYGRDQADRERSDSCLFTIIIITRSEDLSSFGDDSSRRQFFSASAYFSFVASFHFYSVARQFCFS